MLFSLTPSPSPVDRGEGCHLIRKWVRAMDLRTGQALSLRITALFAQITEKPKGAL